MSMYNEIYDYLQLAVDNGEIDAEFAEAVNDLAYDKYVDDGYTYESTRLQREAKNHADAYNAAVKKLQSGGLTPSEVKLYKQKADGHLKWLKNNDRIGDAGLKAGQNLVRGHHGSDPYKDYLSGKGNTWASHNEMISTGRERKDDINNAINAASNRSAGYKYSKTLPERPMTKMQADAIKAELDAKAKDAKDAKKRNVMMRAGLAAVTVGSVGASFGLSALTKHLQAKKNTVSDKNVDKYIASHIIKLENEIEKVDTKTASIIEDAPGSEDLILKAAKIKKDYLNEYINALKNVHTAAGYEMIVDKFTAKAATVTAKTNKILYKAI